MSIRAIRKHLRQDPHSRGAGLFSPAAGQQLYRHQREETAIRLKAAYAQIAQLEQDFFAEYLAENFYHSFITHDQIRGVKPDHVRIADDSADDLKPIKPLILDKVSIRNIRQVTEFVLSFVQSIPYSTLESRVTSSGAGFNPPLKLLWQNQGDCDSKLTLTAALLRTLMPRIKMLMVYIDQHAFIGINIPVQGGRIDAHLRQPDLCAGRAYRPRAQLKLGVLAPESEQAILQGRYTTQALPPKSHFS